MATHNLPPGRTRRRSASPRRLAQYIVEMRDGGAEWGWEFKLSEG